MLTKLILLNSAKFSKVVLAFDKTIHTVQLVGGNRFGKTSLLNALNFLFVADGRELKTLFGDYTLQQTLNYYFPRENESFILYQIYKNGFFTILLKTENGKLAYYKYNQAYKEAHFFDETKRLRTFKEIESNLLLSGIALQSIDNGQDYLNFAYSRDKRNNNCVVWLKTDVKSSGLNNPFTEMYKCLVKPKWIDNERLKDALMIAYSRKDRNDLEFSKSKEKDLLTLQRYLQEVKNIKNISDEFNLLKKLVDKFNLNQERIDKLYHTFLFLYESEIQKIKTNVKELDTKVKSAEQFITHTLQAERDSLFESQGEKKVLIKIENKKLSKLDDNIKESREIRKSNSIVFLKELLSKAQQAQKDIEYEFEKIKKENITETSINQAISKTKSDIISLDHGISGKSNQLIQCISSDENTRQLFNRILTDDIKRLPKSVIQNKISTITDFLKLADGVINISNVEPLAFKTIGELTIELDEKKRLLVNHGITLDTIRKTEEFKKQLEYKESEIITLTRKIDLLEKEQNFIIQQTEIKKTIVDFDTEIKKLGTQITGVADKMTAKWNEIEKDRNEIEILTQRTKHLKIKFDELKEKGILPKSNTSERTDIDSIIRELWNHISEAERLGEEKKRKLESLKKSSGKTSVEEVFIQEVEEEIIGLQQKEDSIEGLLMSISQSFSGPADRLLKSFQEFRDDIRAFNTQLAKIRISDIQEIKLNIEAASELIQNITKIQAIRELRPHDLFYQGDLDEDGLKLLKHWLQIEKKIPFEALFDIKAEIIEGTKKRSIDFSKEIESGGTNRMVKFIIFLSIIKKIVVDHADNRVPFCIDETLMIDTQNQEEMIRFCKENHFLPIFAAPDPVKSNIDRFYYVLNDPNAKDKTKPGYVFDMSLNTKK
ncbi:MAG: hypothetical protein RL329_3100 [Bacteroidota bacterium]